MSRLIIDDFTVKAARTGQDVVLASLLNTSRFLSRSFARVEVIHMATPDDNVVVTERREHCYSPDHDDTHDGHFSSVFEIED